MYFVAMLYSYFMYNFIIYVFMTQDFAGLNNITSGIASLVSNHASRKRSAGGHTENIAIELAPFLQTVMSGGYFTYSGSLTTPGRYNFRVFCF